MNARIILVMAILITLIFVALSGHHNAQATLIDEPGVNAEESSIQKAEALNVLALGQVIAGDPAEHQVTNQSKGAGLIPRPVAGETSTTRLATATGAITFGTARGGTGEYDILVQDAATKEVAMLVTWSGNDVTPVWSPNGKQLVFASDHDGDFDIYLRTEDGQEVNLTNNTAEDIHPSWSPNGQRILFSSDRGGGYFQIYTMDLDGQNTSQVGVVPGNNAVYARYSPTGTSIAFMRASIITPICEWNWDIWLMGADGQNQRRVTTHLGGDLYPNWTPGGEIIYASCRNFIDSDLFIVNPNTGAEFRLTNWLLSNEWAATYSPDGANIAFNTNFDGNSEIYVAPSTGGTAENFSQDPAEDLLPSWASKISPQTNISKIEVSQSIQCIDNPACFGEAHRDWCPGGDSDDRCDNVVPLVEGKPTWVRAYITCDSNCAEGGKLYGLLSRSAAPDEPQRSVNNIALNSLATTDYLRRDLDRTLNFHLPENWEDSSENGSDTSVSLTVKIFSVRNGLIVDQAAQEDLTFHEQESLDIRHIGIGYDPPVGESSNPDDDVMGTAHAALLVKILPASMNYAPWTEHQPITITVSPIPYLSLSWNALKLELDTLLASVDKSNQPDILVGWLPDNVTIRSPNNLTWFGVSGVDVRTPIVAANDSAFRTVAHEIAHTLGVGHAPCGVADWIDWPYPYTPVTIQEYGLDPLATSSTALIPDDAPDFMSYCGDGWSPDGDRSWISPYYYKRMFDSAIIRPESTTVTSTPSATMMQNSLLVSGILFKNGEVNFSPFYALPVTPNIPAGGADYCLAFLDNAGNSLSSHCFDLDFIDDHFRQPTESETFAWNLPYPEGTKTIVLEKGEDILEQVQVSPNIPTISIDSPTAGTTWNGLQSITWSATDADGDPLTYRVFYSYDAGQTWIPLSTDIATTHYEIDTDKLPGDTIGHLRVVVSDGINTGMAEVENLSVERKSPRVFITSPQSNATIFALDRILLSGNAYDLEDGGLTSTSLQWYSDADGYLGAGTQILSFLSSGAHTITLTATDSDQNTTEVAIEVHINPPVFLPLVSK